MKAPIKHAVAFFKRNEFYLTLTLDNEYEENAQQFLNNFNETEFEVVIKRKRRVKRSISANAYLWVLLDQIGCFIRSTKEEIYRECVRSVGPMSMVSIKKEGFEKFRSAWGQQGMGWFCDIIGNHPQEGMIDVACYYGSSSYDSREMARLLDFVVDEAKMCGIETIPPKELERMKQEWKQND